MIFSRHTLVYALIWLALVLLAITALSPGLKGDFFFDDEPNIVLNDAIKIKDLTLNALSSSIDGPSAGPLGRPVSVTSFAITYFFFGLDPFAFKAFNLAIHVINALLVAWLVSLLLSHIKTSISAKGCAWLSIWVSTIWLIHPINVLPVMLAVQRMTLLSAMFLLLALIFHLKGISSTRIRKGVFYAIAWVLFWPLAIFSKETGLLLPLYVIVLILLTPNRSIKKNRPIIISALLLSIILLVIVFIIGSDFLQLAYAMRSFSLTERLMTEFRVLWLYASQILLPNFNSFAIYLDDFSVSTGLLKPPSTILSLLLWVLAVFIIFACRKPHPILSISIAWFLVGHSLESTFLPLEIAHEYRNYIPSIGLILGTGYLVTIGLKRLALDYKKTAFITIAIFPFLILGLFTWLRAEQLGKPLIGAQIEASRHPLSARANHSAALSLFRAKYGDINDPLGAQQIKYYFEKSGEVDPSFKHGHLGLIAWSCASGREIEKEWLEELRSRLEYTRFSPDDRSLPDELLQLLLNMPNCLDRAIALNLFITGARNNSIDGEVKAKFLEAASDYELLVSLDPVSARDFLLKAVAAFPQNSQLKNKLENFLITNQKDMTDKLSGVRSN